MTSSSSLIPESLGSKGTGHNAGPSVPGRELERADWVCIFVDVSSVLSFHCSSFAACDAEALVDLGAYARMSAWRLFVLLGRGCLRGRACLRRCFRACCGSTRRASTSPRQMEERGVLRALDQDSEAEAKVSPDQASGTSSGAPA